MCTEISHGISVGFFFLAKIPKDIFLVNQKKCYNIWQIEEVGIWLGIFILYFYYTIMSVNVMWAKEKRRVTSWKNLWATLALAWVLLSATPQEVKSQTTWDVDKDEIWLTISSDTTKKEKSIALTAGFNALETSVTHQWNARIRNFANIWLDIKLGKKETLQLWYSWMNEFSENLAGYFGRHVPNIWLKSVPKLKAIGVIKTTADGVLDAKYGLRYLVSDQMGVDYWWLDVAWNDQWASVTFFLWKDLWKKWTNVELLTDIQIDGKNKKILAPYTELQLNQSISKGFNVFIRWEVSWIDFNHGQYLFGVSKKL